MRSGRYLRQASFVALVGAILTCFNNCGNFQSLRLDKQASLSSSTAAIVACQGSPTNSCMNSTGMIYSVNGTYITSANEATPAAIAYTLTETTPISNFTLSPDESRIYYVMGGSLYCFAVNMDTESADCRNRKADLTSIAAMGLHTHGPLISGIASNGLVFKWVNEATLSLQSGMQTWVYQVPQPSPVTQDLIFGVNLTRMPTNAQIDAQFEILKARHLRGVRFGGNPNSPAAARAQYIASKANALGMKIDSLIDVAWLVCPADAKTFKSNDATTNYNIAYQATYNFVLPLKDVITDWELGNEITIKAGQTTPPGAWNSGWLASDWANVSALGSSDYFGLWAATIKGQADAIDDINKQYGTHLRRIINIVFTHVGFLDYLQQAGVNYEVISYHYYQRRNTSAYSLSGKQPGSAVNSWNLFASLAAYHRPVILNEINCAEVYNSQYQNAATDPLYATCLANLRAQLNYFRHNTQIDLEAIYAYEMYDEPAKAAPENHFGMFFSSDSQFTTVSPKAHLYLWSEFAGGELSSDETSVLKSFGLLPLPSY